MLSQCHRLPRPSWVTAMYCKDDKDKKVDLGKGVSRQVMSYGGGMMAVTVDFEKDAMGAAHAHPHEQITYCVSGRFLFTLDGVQEILNPGDTLYCGPDLVHGITCLEAGRVMDVFTPIRQDFL